MKKIDGKKIISKKKQCDNQRLDNKFTTVKISEKKEITQGANQTNELPSANPTNFFRPHVTHCYFITKIALID